MKIKKFLNKIFLGFILTNFPLLTHAQEIPPVPANVISNHYTTTNFSTPAAILFQTTNLSVQVSNVLGKVWDVNLRTAITHSFPVDIDMFLTSPQGTQVHLTSSSAGNGNGGGADDVFNGTWWDDQASTNVSDATYVNLVLQPFLQPEDAMSAFDGENPNGTWTLTITDTFIFDDGLLNSAQLDIATYIGQATCVTKSYTNSILTPIPDNGSINPIINVVGLPYRISQVKIFTKITHTSSADLDIILTSPAGTMTTLTTDRGGVNDNIFNGTLWFDDAFISVSSITNVFMDNVVETELVPEGALGTFKGENPNGNWTLMVADDTANAEVGSLTNWYIEITTCSGGVNDVDGDGFTDIVGLKKKEVRVLSQVTGVTSSNAISVGKLPKGYKAVGGYDANTNNISDLLVQRKDEISYLTITNGQISDTPVVIGSAPKKHKAAAFGDINSDGSTDIIVTKGKKVGALMGPSYTFQEIIDKNKDGKVVGVVQTNIITQKGKKVFRIPITASGTNSPTVGDAINLTEEATGKIVGVSEINGTDGLEIIAQKKKDVTYGPAESGNATLDLWTDKGIDKDGQLGKVIAPK